MEQISSCKLNIKMILVSESTEFYKKHFLQWYDINNTWLFRLYQLIIMKIVEYIFEYDSFYNFPTQLKRETGL